MNMLYDERLDGPLPTVDKRRVLSDLRDALPLVQILDSDEQMAPFACDGMSSCRSIPLLVVLPNTVADVQTLMRYCDEHDIPVVPRGAGTGLSGGAMPVQKGILLSLTRLNQIIHVDTLRCA
jgi:glycolate oxidase